MKKILQLLSLVPLALAITACSPDGEQDVAPDTEATPAPEVAAPSPPPMPPQMPPPQANLLWQAPGFHRPESSHYDPVREQIYVSNVGGEPTDSNRTGFLTLVTVDGIIDKLRWVDNLQAPKGLVLCQDRLYVADLDEVLEIDPDSARILNVWGVPDAGFLNDVACSPDGKVYVSDMGKDRIYVVENSQLSLWLESPELENPNGLFGAEEGLVLASWGVMTADDFSTEVPGHLKVIDYQTQAIRPLVGTEPLGNLDGLEIDRYGHHLVSDWMSGKIFHLSEGQPQTMLALAQGAADIGYIPDGDILLVPMMMDDLVTAYQLERPMEDGMESGMESDMQSGMESGMQSGMDAMEAGMDAGMDAMEAGMEAGMESGMQSGMDAGMDAMDAGMQSGMEAGMDAGMDAMESGMDAGMEAGMEAMEATMEPAMEAEMPSETGQ